MTEYFKDLLETGVLGRKDTKPNMDEKLMKNEREPSVRMSSDEEGRLDGRRWC